MVRLAQFVPMELGAEEGGWIGRIWNVLDLPAEAGEFLLPAPSDGAGQFGFAGEVDEVLKRRRRGPFLALKEHRHIRRQQHQSCADFTAIAIDQMADAIAARAIA